MKKMEEPAKQALDTFYREEYDEESQQGGSRKEPCRRSFRRSSMPATFVTELKRIAPKLRTSRARSTGRPNAHPADSVFRSGPDQRGQRFDGSDRPEPRIAGAARDTDDLLHGLPGHRVRAGESMGLLSNLGVRGRRTLPARAEVREEIPPVLARACSLPGVFLCFFFVLPITLNFLLQFNVWLGVAPTLAAERMDEFRHDTAADLRSLVSDAARHAVPGADQYLHRR